MFSKRLLILALLGLPVVASAQDVIILASGQNLKGHVLRYDATRFTIMVGTEVKEIPADDVHSVFFDIDVEETSPPTSEIVAPATSAPPVVAAVLTSAPPVATTAPAVATSAAPAGPYGLVEKNLSVNEYMLHGPSLTGKVVKLEFFYRTPIQAGKTEPYMATIADKQARIEIEFGKEPYAWFKQLPDHIVYTDITWQKARAYYLYGVVGEGKTKAFVNGLPAEAQAFHPIGRKTKKGMRGALEYGW